MRRITQDEYNLAILEYFREYLQDGDGDDPLDIFLKVGSSWSSRYGYEPLVYLSQEAGRRGTLTCALSFPAMIALSMRKGAFLEEMSAIGLRFSVSPRGGLDRVTFAAFEQMGTLGRSSFIEEACRAIQEKYQTLIKGPPSCLSGLRGFGAIYFDIIERDGSIYLVFPAAFTPQAITVMLAGDWVAVLERGLIRREGVENLLTFVGDLLKWKYGFGVEIMGRVLPTARFCLSSYLSFEERGK